ncbi:cyclin-domain-containing protein [Xylariaceae sp. FL0594]|nr:cyclin-domain-containing protein [Xylariaceae sp. FL0594]
MAAAVGDYVADHSRFHNMIPSSAIQQDNSKPRDSPYRSEYNSRLRQTSSQKTHSPVSSTYSRSSGPGGTSSKRPWDPAESVIDHKHTVSDGASRFPSPPDSSASNPPSARERARDSNTFHSFMASGANQALPAPSSSAPASPQQLSPESNTANSPAEASTAYNASAPPQGRTIVVRDLAHIQSLARADVMNGGNGPGILNDPPLQAMKYEISNMPIGDIIEMVAALLTKITATNDFQHDALNRNVTHQQAAANHNSDGSSMSPLSSSVLAFHGKNVPAITILSYLSRIHKYCPTTYEVFLSLLVYFDRMTERVNNLVMAAEESRRMELARDQPPKADTAEGVLSAESDAEMRDDEYEGSSSAHADEGRKRGATERAKASPADGPAAAPSTTYFVVDSYNIHRLIIAGVTCASKFFSDVFYTNSRYAKVGGLPLAELNHLELQFLLLNDFRLCVAVEDLDAYATMLVEFYAREIVDSRPRHTSGSDRSAE